MVRDARPYPYRSAHLYGNEFQFGDVLEVLGIGGEQGEIALDGLGRDPEILDAKVTTTAGLRELGGEAAEDFRGFAGNAQQRFAAEPAEHGHDSLLLLRIGHPFDAKEQFGHVDQRQVDGVLLCDGVNIRGAEGLARSRSKDWCRSGSPRVAQFVELSALGLATRLDCSRQGVRSVVVEGTIKITEDFEGILGRGLGNEPGDGAMIAHQDDFLLLGFQAIHDGAECREDRQAPLARLS